MAAIILSNSIPNEINSYTLGLSNSSSSRKSGVIFIQFWCFSNIKCMILHSDFKIDYWNGLHYNKQCFSTIQSWLIYLAAIIGTQLDDWSAISQHSFPSVQTELCHPVVPRKVSQRSSRLSAGKSHVYLNSIKWFGNLKGKGRFILVYIGQHICHLW